MKMGFRRWILALLVIGVVLFGLIQLVPIGRNHTNAPVLYEPAWDSPRTEQLVRGACYDCHSNQTVWPWYSNVAPASWLLYSDITRAKNSFNFNEIDAKIGAALVGEMVENVQENSMPPFQYQMMHPEARFSANERQELIDGLLATFK